MKKKSIFHPVWKDYFSFSRRERRGIIVLLIILFSECAVLYFLHDFSLPGNSGDLQGYRWEAELFFKRNDSASTPVKPQQYTKTVYSPVVKKLNKLIPFDPNHTDSAGWISLGLSPGQARMIRNYVSHGGKFKKKDDLQKMYCLRDGEYKKLEPWILLPDSDTTKYQPKNFKKEEKHPIIADLAKTDSAGFLPLPGIGPSFASRIVHYREKLGGFHSLNQLREVWGMTDSLFGILYPFVFLTDSIPFRTINLNQVTEEALRMHPYIGSRLARIIIAYRNQHGSFSDVEQLRHVPLVSEEIFRKLEPYLRADKP